MKSAFQLACPAQVVRSEISPDDGRWAIIGTGVERPEHFGIEMALLEQPLRPPLSPGKFWYRGKGRRC